MERVTGRVALRGDQGFGLRGFPGEGAGLGAVGAGGVPVFVRGIAGGAGPDGLERMDQRGFGGGVVEGGQHGEGAAVGEAGGDGVIGVALGFAGEFGFEGGLGEQQFGFGVAGFGFGELGGCLDALDRSRDMGEVGGGDDGVGGGFPAVEKDFSCGAVAG